MRLICIMIPIHTRTNASIHSCRVFRGGNRESAVISYHGLESYLYNTFMKKTSALKFVSTQRKRADSFFRY